MDRETLKQKYGNEQILVIPTPIVRGVPDGFKLIPAILNPRYAKFEYRYLAEYNYDLTQIVVYVLIFNETGDKLYITKRLGGEERLQQLFSIGAGGHVNINDVGKNILDHAANRELNEELKARLIENTSLKQIGTIRDLSSDTRDHLGIVYRIKADKVAVREKDNLSGQWMDVDQLKENYKSFESWGRIILDTLFKIYNKEGTLFSIKHNM